MNLKALRDDIDNIDEKMRILFEERMTIVKKVKEYKKKHAVDIYDKTREDEVISKNVSQLKDPSLEKSYEKFLIHLMQLSKDLQQ